MIITLAAAYMQIWVLTAVPSGFFGFSGKGRPSAFSEVLVMKDRRKLLGLWILIVTTLAFALLQMLGWVPSGAQAISVCQLHRGRRPLRRHPGGCISGCLFKAATGNLNSIAGLRTIPAGVMAVEFGPL